MPISSFADLPSEIVALDNLNAVVSGAKRAITVLES